MGPRTTTWKPLQAAKLAEIATLFNNLFPRDPYPGLADEISVYWVSMLRSVWEAKSPDLKQKDTRYCPGDPLSRIEQKTVVIAYADSVRAAGEATLETLDSFLATYFPAIGGLHLLPACQVMAERFNDGYFSQVVRDRVHPAFGTNRTFAALIAKYFSMADFVLNHVDIANPSFQAYLGGDDSRQDCFYIFSEDQYQRRLKRGDFSRIFRPRPFPLFTIFRRKPDDAVCAALSPHDRMVHMQGLLGGPLPLPVIGLLSIFNKLKNDQMLLDDDYRQMTEFIDFLDREKPADPERILTVSATQETRRTPYILRERLQTPRDLLRALGYDRQRAATWAARFEQLESEVFGVEIRALTTFSHVQVDLNTATFPGLKMLADDFSWYLGLDLNMLRLDAANFAFKRWQSTCFGLPEVKGLMKILYLSMACVAPRMVANLEVNDTLSSILNQMAAKKNPPPMMYDFHLAGMLPAAFISRNAGLFKRIYKMIAGYDLPADTVRFSLAESHDGKSVRGSLDLLTLAERQALADTAEANGGRIKYKGVPQRRLPGTEFQEICRASDLDYQLAVQRLFKPGEPGEDTLVLKDAIGDVNTLAAVLGVHPGRMDSAGPLKYLVNKIFRGREPYELCVATRDCLPKLVDPRLETARYLAFYTLAFALMGRHVKSVYFNDLTGISNDYKRFRETGELRDLKRTKSELATLSGKLADPNASEYTIGRGLNHLIALVDSDPSLGVQGGEARASVAGPGGSPDPVALVRCGSDTPTLVVVNLTPEQVDVSLGSDKFDLPQDQALYDNIGQRTLRPTSAETLSLQPFGRLWLTARKIKILPQLMLT